MYCNNCGKHNPEDSKFCKSCGLKIIRIPAENITDNQAQAEASSEAENKKTLQSNEKVNAGLGGWLSLVGLGLIIGLLWQAYGTLEYLPLLSDTYNIPGYLILLQIEFFVSIIFTLVIAYLLYLYFKKNKNFPKYYVVFLISSVIYVVLDHLFLASLSAPTQKLQQVINDALSQNSSNVGRTIVTSIIWVAYIKKSKRVKATFIKNN